MTMAHGRERLTTRPRFPNYNDLMTLPISALQVMVAPNNLYRNDFFFEKTNIMYNIFNCNAANRPGRTYYYEMMPMLLTMRALGRFPFHFNKNGIKAGKLLSIPVVYTAVFFIIQTIWTITAVWQLFTQKLTKDADFDQFIFWTSILSFLGQNFIIPLTFWQDSPRFVNYVSQWDNMQENFKKCGLLVGGKFSKIVLCMTLLNFPFCFLVITVELNILGDLNIYFFLAFACVLISSMTELLIWCATLKKICIMADLLLKMVERTICIPANQHSINNILKARKLWLELSEATTGLGHSLAKTAITTTSSLFISFVLSTYGFLSTVVISNVRSPSNIALVIVSSMTFISSYIIFDRADRTVEKVGCKFKSAIMKMETANSTSLYANVLQQFVQTIHVNPPIIHYDGFVVVNRNLFVNFISNTVTYLVVLLQFKSTTQNIV